MMKKQKLLRFSYNSYFLNKRNHNPILFTDSKATQSILLRGLNSVVLTVFYYYGYQKLQLSEAVVLFQTNPALIGILSAFFLNEVYDLYQFSFTVLSFIGVVLIVKPPFCFGEDSLDDEAQAIHNEKIIGYMSMIAGSLFFAIQVVLARKQIKYRIPANTGLFYAFISESVGLPIFCSFQGVTAITFE